MKNSIETAKLCHEIKHPVMAHYLALMRDKATAPAEFRRIMSQMGHFLAYEATRDLLQGEREVETPLEKTSCKVITEKIIIASILRAGLGMMDGIMEALPFARVGHIGIYRDKFIHNTVEYYFRLPQDMENKRILLVDPMLATGDTALAAINRLKEYGAGPIRLLCLLSAPEGLAHVKEFHPDVEIYTASVERELNAKGYILPGVGDAGDRLYGTFES